MKINLTIPLYNEELILAENVKKILDFIYDLPVKSDGIASFPRIKCGVPRNDQYEWQIILADNASTDKTGEISRKIVGANNYSPLRQIKYFYIPQKGKGRAIKAGWQKFPADYYLFMDADLSTDLEALPRLIVELENGADMTIGSRYLPESQTHRSFGRGLISRIFHWIARTRLGLPFSDLPCGFKGVNQKIIQKILPQIKNNEWFFDTELLYRAYQAGCKIKEIPVVWNETIDQKRKSRVGLIKVSWGYLKELRKHRSR